MAPHPFKSIVRFLQLSCPKLSMLLGLWEEALKSRTPDMGNSELCESHLSRKTLINLRR